MATSADLPDGAVSPPPAAGQWPTGAKLFVIISVALLPLAIIAIFATFQTTRAVSSVARAGLRVAATEGSRALAIELSGDMTALRGAVDSLARDPINDASCARVQGVFAQVALGVRFAIVDRGGRRLCGDDFPGAVDMVRRARAGQIVEHVDPGRGLRLAVASPRSDVIGVAAFSTAFLEELSQPTGFAPDHAAMLTGNGGALTLRDLPMDRTLERRESNRTPLGIGSLAFEMQVRALPITSPMLIAMLLPLVMWAAAASIAWFVVDRLLIRPLRQLRSDVAALAPGQELDAEAIHAIPATEIRELGETFRAISRTVLLHEKGLAEGLVRQTKLTREVHHRVKNNLQVIASLISLHARGARSVEAAQAYASIQRRVDALAVVHRNHFAEMEDNRGLSLRAMIGELASNLRATAPEGSSLAIFVDVDPLAISQDGAVAVSFLVTEIVELALSCDPAARVHISIKPAGGDIATFRISSPALAECPAMQPGVAARYGRVIEGLSRQLRAKLYHDPPGVYQIALTVIEPE